MEIKVWLVNLFTMVGASSLADPDIVIYKTVKHTAL